MSWPRLGLSCVIAGVVMACSIAPVRAGDAKAESSHTADAAHPAAEAPGGGVFDPDLAIWSVVVFVVLLVVLKKFAWGPILEALEGREHKIANHIAEAERNHEEAKRLLAQYEQKLVAAAQEVRELMVEARRDAEHTRQEILAEAKAGAEAERARALRDIDSATDAALESLARRSAQLAVDLAGKILQHQLTADEHSKLIEEAVAQFPTTTSSRN